LTATNSPANPIVITAKRITRLFSAFIRDSSLLRSGFVASLAFRHEEASNNALRRPARLPYAYGSFYGVNLIRTGRPHFISRRIRDWPEHV